MSLPRREHELRCFCKNKPLLATYGIDRRGKLFLHVKIYKQERIYGEIVVTEGSVKIRCRNCKRWHGVRIVGHYAELVRTERPETLPRANAATVLDA